MLNYLKKFTVDIFPSVAATVIGAYIVNHYIVSRPSADAPAAAVSTADPKGKAKAATDANPEGTTAVSNLPAAGVKARGISEKAVTEKNAAEQRPAVAEKVQEKAGAKADAAKAEAIKVETVKADAKADAKHDAKSTETAAPREKEKIRVVLPSPIQPAASTSAPVAAAPNPVAPVETAAAPAPAQEERRDANDLARAAIERLRLNGEGSARAPEVARIPDTPKEAPRAETPKAETPEGGIAEDRGCAGAAAAAATGHDFDSANCRRALWSGRAATAALRGRWRAPSDAAGRDSALAPARSACRARGAFRARAHDGRCRRGAVDGEVAVPRRAAEIKYLLKSS